MLGRSHVDKEREHKTVFDLVPTFFIATIRAKARGTSHATIRAKRSLWRRAASRHDTPWHHGTTRHTAMTKWPECPHDRSVILKRKISIKPSKIYRTSILDIDSSRIFYADFESEVRFA